MSRTKEHSERWFVNLMQCWKKDKAVLLQNFVLKYAYIWLLHMTLADVLKPISDFSEGTNFISTSDDHRSDDSDYNQTGKPSVVHINSIKLHN